VVEDVLVVEVVVVEVEIKDFLNLIEFSG